MKTKDPETKIIRNIGRNFAFPIWKGEVSSAACYKFSGDGSDASPVTIADVGSQILFTRERKKLCADDPVFGEEYVPRFSKKKQTVIENYDITKPLSLERKVDREFIALLNDLVGKKKTLPKSAADQYLPLRAEETCIDPIDGTICFKEGLKGYSIQASLLRGGRVTEAWIYRPVQDQMFRRIGSKPSEYVTFEKESGKEYSHPIAQPPKAKPLSEMTIVYARAHPNVVLDDITKPLYVQNGELLPFKALARRYAGQFKRILPTDGYSYHHGEMFLGRVDAVATPGTAAWDHFAQAHIAMGAGYAVRFFDGQDYLGKHGEVPLVLDKKKGVRLKQTGGLLYAPPDRAFDLNWKLNVAHHPRHGDILVGENLQVIQRPDTSKTVFRPRRLAALP